PENREKLAADVAKKLGVATRAVAVPQQAAVGADLVYVATNSGGRVVLRHGQLGSARFVASIGSTLPEQRELDAGVLVAADHLILDTWDGLDESGDALAAAAVGLDRSRAMLLGNMPAGLRGRPGLTVYKSIGSPEQDLVLAHAILEDAAERGYGQPMEPLSAVKKNL
ncbi:MAG TPA: hypothetical protein VFQ15_01090, partial [Jiangellaceae bacterium]|nr:hypothetical protein [Jiangellaceae bacterium]